jgi:hypothetical protein
VKKYRVVSRVTISMHTDVEAKSIKDAKEIALGRPLVRLCWQCSGGDKTTKWCTSGELDGEPKIVEVDVIESEEE